MRVAIITVSACVALFFMTALVLTFFAKDYITGQAQEFVTVRTQRFAEPTVELAEQGLQAPGIKQVLDDEAIETVRREIADYRRDPRAYIAGLVAGERQPAPAVVPGQAAPLKERLLRWKNQVRDHFERTLGQLVLDLRIFSGSNLAAALLAAWCALRAKDRSVNWLIGVAGLLLASVAYGATMYVDGFTYFRILFNTYLGWWYPVLLATTFLSLYLEYGRRDQTPPNQAASAPGRSGAMVSTAAPAGSAHHQA